VVSTGEGQDRAGTRRLSEHVLEEIERLPDDYPEPRSAVMPALDLAQEELGYLTPESMSQVAVALSLDPGYVEGVATFYSLFHLQPVGRHRIYMCTNIACLLRGAEELTAQLREKLELRDADQITADGLFSVEEVECLGACEYAPVARLDHRFHYDLTLEKLEGLIAERRGRSAEPAAAQTRAASRGRNPKKGGLAGGPQGPVGPKDKKSA
jgi:NADH-quinone oxidoreductase subunit E